MKSHKMLSSPVLLSQETSNTFKQTESDDEASRSFSSSDGEEDVNGVSEEFDDDEEDDDAESEAAVLTQRVRKDNDKENEKPRMNAQCVPSANKKLQPPAKPAKAEKKDREPKEPEKIRESYDSESHDDAQDDNNTQIQPGQLLYEFLRSLGLERIFPTFQREEIDLIDLPLLSEEELRDNFHIKLGPRRRILKAIEMLEIPPIWQPEMKDRIQKKLLTSFPTPVPLTQRGL